MSRISNDDAGVVVTNLVKVIQDNKQYLSDIDGEIGDGDHGVNMNKGFTMAGQALAAEPGNLSRSLKVLGTTLLNDIGGSMGPLYGMLFRRMAKACRNADAITADVFDDMLRMAREGIAGISEAQVGDKTLVDVLEPAAVAYHDAHGEGVDFVEALQRMKRAAEGGRDSTRDMVAKLGRSSRLGERSRGVLDAGAASCCLILCTMADTFTQLIAEEAPAPV